MHIKTGIAVTVAVAVGIAITVANLPKPEPSKPITTAPNYSEPMEDFQGDPQILQQPPETPDMPVEKPDPKNYPTPLVTPDEYEDQQERSK